MKSLLSVMQMIFPLRMNRESLFGHSNTRTFGEQSVEAKQFAAFLMNHGLEKDKPVTIDLLGCEIGYCGADIDVESYVHKVYRSCKTMGIRM